MACLFLSGSCNVRYRATERDLYNEHLKNNDTYPKTFEAALKNMNDYQTLKILEDTRNHKGKIQK